MIEKQIGTLIDPKKKEVVLQRIKDGKVPFCAEKPAPEKPAAAEAQSQLITSTAVPNPNFVILDQKLNYIEAWKTAKAQNMRIAPHILHDDCLVMSDLWRTIKQVYPAWCREWLVYPEMNGVFEPGKDIEDTHELNGEKWHVIFPAKYIPLQALSTKGMGLFVDPTGIESDASKKQLIVHANLESIIILNKFLQEDGWGQADAITRIPLAVAEDVLNTLADNQKRYLWRVGGNGVRPLARCCNDVNNDRVVNASDDFDRVLGVCLIP
jgi:hypothetical protein